MKLLNRELKAILIQNTGNGILGNAIDISDGIKDINSSGFSLDEVLNKASLGNMTMKVIDRDGSIWTFIQDELESTDGIYPPFVVIMLGDRPIFYGVADCKVIEKSLSYQEMSISINAMEWYSMFGKLELDQTQFKRSYPVKANPRPASTARSGFISKYLVICGYIWAENADFLSRVWFDKADGDFFEVNDTFTSSIQTGTFTCISKKEVSYPTVFPGRTFYEVQLANFKWPNNGGAFLEYAFNQGACDFATFQRLAEVSSEQSFFVVQQAITNTEGVQNYTIKLDTVSGLVPGDKLELRSTGTRTDTATFQILDVDTEDLAIICSEEIDIDLIIGDLLYYSDESINQLVFEDFKDIVSKANSIGGTDFSRFQPAALSEPCLSWLPFRVLNGTGGSSSLLVSPSDIQPGTGNLVEVKGQGNWSGSPELGWSNLSSWVPKVDWTSQLTSAPSTLMPDETVVFAPLAPKNNHNHSQANWSIENWPSGDDTDEENGYVEGENDTSLACVGHDYRTMNRYYFTRNGQVVGGAAEHWNGTAFVEIGGIDWSINSIPQQVIPSVSAEYIYVKDNAGRIRMIQVSDSICVAQTMLEPSIKNGRLKTTPYGEYIICKGGYGKLVSMWPDVGVRYVALTEDKEISLMPTTFCAYDANTIFTLATTKYMVDDKPKYEVYAILLKADPDPAKPEEAIISFEKVSDGSPKLARAFKNGNRVFGLLGSRLFQLSNQMSTVIERYSVSGLTAQQLIENVCLIHNAYSYGNSSGVMEIVSRNWSSAPINVAVGIKSQTEARLSDYFLSQVNVSGNTDDVFSWATSDRAGGKVYEISSHPFLTTESQCRATALSYISFFGKDRKKLDMVWIYDKADVDPVAPWEGLRPNQIITINGDSKQWYLIKCDADFKYQASVSLLEV